ncbi:hypothetical protein FOA52_005745 [Chlamydomonas sp. UWO 241]|nr:hypothetical protein FOA52_005745 [Chlamydomonas sp. UWO 241]
MGTPMLGGAGDSDVLMGMLLTEDEKWMDVAIGGLQQGRSSTAGGGSLKAPRGRPHAPPPPPHAGVHGRVGVHAMDLGSSSRLNASGTAFTPGASAAAGSSRTAVATSGGGRAAVRRAARDRERSSLTELEARLTSLSATHVQLQAENGMLRRRMQLLESGVQMREQTLQGLIKTRSGRLCTGSDAGVAKSQSQSSPQQQQQSEAGCSSSSGPREQGSPATTTCAACGASTSSSGAPSAGARHPLHSWTKFEQFPDPEVDEWDAELCAAVREMTPLHFQRIWIEFVQEVSMLAFSVQVHGPGSDVAARLTRVVSYTLTVSDRMVLLNPLMYNRSMYVNMLTGAPQVPDHEFWRKCMESVSLTKEQLEFCKTLMDEHTRRMGSLLDERSRLASELGSKLVFSPVETSSSSVLNAKMEVTELTAKIESNVAKEYNAHSFIADFLTVKVLTPVQIALLAAAAFPIFPDATAMAAVALELAEPHNSTPEGSS